MTRTKVPTGVASSDSIDVPDMGLWIGSSSRPSRRFTLGPGARSLRSLQRAVLGLGMHEWLRIVEPDVVYAGGQVEGRCNCDTSSAECAWT